MGFLKWMTGIDIPSTKELQRTMPSRQRSQRSSRSSRPRSYHEDYGYDHHEGPPSSQPQPRSGIVRLQDGRKAFTRHTPLSNRQADRDNRQPSYQNGMFTEAYSPEPHPGQPYYSPQPPRNDLHRDNHNRQDFNTAAVGLGRSRTLYDSSRPRHSRSTSYHQPTYTSTSTYEHDPSFARAFSNADRAGPPRVDAPRPTRLIQHPNHSYNIHLHAGNDATSHRHHNLMVRNYGLECAICIELDIRQFGYVPRPSGYMEVGVDDPYCFHCGLCHPVVDGVDHGSFGRRVGRLRRYDVNDMRDEDGLLPSERLELRTRPFDKQAREEIAQEEAAKAAEKAEAVVEGSGVVGVIGGGDGGGDSSFGTFPNAAKGGKNRKKEGQPGQQGPQVPQGQ